MKSNSGKIVIISSPSGGGKTSICRKLLTPSRKRSGWKFSLSYTTRLKRPGEVNKREYVFVTKEKFKEFAKSGYFAEHCLVHRYYYGTPRKPLENVLKKGGVMILDVDVQGAFKLKKVYPDAITIFILPPSLKELKNRLLKRGTETDEQLKVRFENAKKEMKLKSKFEYTVINNKLEEAVKEVLDIIKNYEPRNK
jgi:guanylate kinase